MTLPNQLPLAEQIEYYLGKDSYRNKFFRSLIPSSWELPFNQTEIWPGVDYQDLANSTHVYNNIEFKFNNLGYRSNYNYTVDQLKGKRNVLCLGDCYVFGPTNHYSELWTTQLQQLLPEYNIVNMAMPICAFDTVARIGTQMLQAIGGSVEHVLVMPPTETSREFVCKLYQKIIAAKKTVTDIPYEDYWEHIDWVSNNYNYYKNYFLLKGMTEAQGGKYTNLLITANDIRYHQEKQITQQWPSGPLLQQAIASWFYKKIVGLPSKFEELQK